MADRQRVLIGDYTRAELRERICDGTIRAAIVPTGTTEQHLEHLEICHDSASVSHIAHAAAGALAPAVVCAPTVQVGVSEHHMVHPGSLTTRVGTFLDYVFDITESLVRGGIGNVLVLNGHGGHMHPLRKELPRFRQLLPDSNIVYASYWDLYSDDELYPLVETKRAPGHADEYETAFALAAFPERVHHDRIDDDGAKRADVERGRRAVDLAVGHVADLLRRMLDGDSPTIEPHSFRPDGTVTGAENFPYQSGRAE